MERHSCQISYMDLKLNDAECNAVRVKSAIWIARFSENSSQSKMKRRNVVSNQIEGCLSSFGQAKRFSKF